MESKLQNRVAAAALIVLTTSVGGWGNSFAAPAIYNLGVLPPLGPGFDYDSSFGHGVSADGSTVTGFVRGAEHGERAFRWTKSGGMEDLGILGGGFSLSLGEALNADGTVVVGLCATVGSSSIRAFRWTASTGMVGLGTLGGAISMARAVSADGSVVTGLSSDDQGRERAFRWTEGGGMEDLGTLPGFESAGAHAITADGSIVAGWSGNRAVVWIDGAALDLGVLPGFPRSVAYALSGDGLVAAGESYNFIDGVRRAFRWTETLGMVDLGVLPGMTISTARGINHDGSAIVGVSGNRAFLWTEALGMVDLNVFLPAVGVDLTGWHLESAGGISADGLAMTGTGFFNGERRAWVAVIPAPVGIIGLSITTTSQVNAGPIEMRTDTVVHPGVEIQFGDAADFSWMVAGDSINVEPHPNPNAPWRYEILFGATHTFEEGDMLNLAFTLPYPLVYGAAAITIAETVTHINGVNNGNTLAFQFMNMHEVSQGDFGGHVRIVFQVIECHGDLNGDGVVDFVDFSIVLAAYGTCLGDPNYNPDADLNGDGCVDFADFSTALAEYGNEC